MVVFSVVLVYIVYFLWLIMLIAAIGVSSVKILYMDHVACCMIWTISCIKIAVIYATASFL
jgi:hypothetical protein